MQYSNHIFGILRSRIKDITNLKQLAVSDPFSVIIHQNEFSEFIARSLRVNIQQQKREQILQ